MEENMYKITKVEHLVDKDWLMVVEAPFVARNAEPGQFMIAKLGEPGERIMTERPGRSPLSFRSSELPRRR